MNVLHLTDTHLRSDPTWRLHGHDVHARFRRTLDAIRSHSADIDAILVTGDISHDEGDAVYTTFRDEMAQFGCPVRVIPGNHDVPTAFANTFTSPEAGAVAERFATRLGAWRIVCLNSQIPGHVHGAIGEVQLRRLRELLAREEPAPTLIALHHPATAVGTPWLDALCAQDGEALLDLAAAHAEVRALLCGHVHQASMVEVRPGLCQLTTPATAPGFRPGATEFEIDDQPPGMRWLTLAPDGTFKTRVETL
jgi:3',5'-cyclic-AMP phosphodiesterase